MHILSSHKFDEKTQELLKSIDESYYDYDKNKQHLKHTISINSKELMEIYEKLENHNLSLKEEIDAKTLLLKQYKDAIDATMVISKTDTFGRITYVNDTFCELSGYSKEELIGSSHRIIRHPDESSSKFKEMWETIIDNKSWHGELKNRAKDGSSYYVDVNIFPLRDKHNSVLEYIAIRTDITDRVKAEKKLEREHKYNEMLFNDQENILFTSNKESGILRANRQFFRVLNFDNIEDFKVKYSCICELFIEKDGYLSLSIPQKHWTDDIVAEPKKQHKAIMLNREGEERIYSVILTHIDFNDKKSIITSLTDITEVENARKLAEKSEKVKSEFMANMSHEIRTPMNGIVGFTDLLLTGNLDSKQREFTNNIKNSTTILLKIINDILDFSKIESGNMELDFSSMNPFIELTSILKIFKPLAKNKDISFVLNMDSSMSECLIIDKLRVTQILTNLINNALKFTPKEGTVMVSIVSEKINANQEKILFSVEDSGIGIPEERLESIFQEFVQADSSTTRNFGGTGLGLSISASLCQLMGATLNVESQEGVGSKFYFELLCDVCSVETPLAEKNNHHPIYILEEESEVYANVITQLKHFKLDVIPLSFEELLCSDDSDKLVVIFNYKQYRPLVLNGFKIILIDKSKEADKLAQKENIAYHIGIYEEVASTIYNAILEYNLSDKPIVNVTINQEFDLKILIAEDYEMNRILIEEMLLLYNLVPEFALNGVEAVDKLSKDEYDIIFMDINMPEMNGTDATKHLRSIGLKTPIIALTANALEGDRERFLADGMDDYLSKPIDNRLLEELLIKYQNLKEDSSDKKDRVIEIEKGQDREIEIELFVTALREAQASMHFSTAIIIRLFNSFLPNAIQNIESLKIAQEQKDMETIYAKAHALRGTALSLKFTTIAEPCDRLEYAVKERRDIDYEKTILEASMQVSFLEENAQKIIKILNEE